MVRFLVIIFFCIQTFVCFSQLNSNNVNIKLVLELEKKLNLSFNWEESIKSKDEFCSIPINHPTKAINIDSLNLIFRLLKESKDYSLIPLIAKLQDKYISHLEPLWEKYYNFKDKSQNCKYFWDHYNIAFDFEVTMISLKCSVVNDPKEIFNYYILFRDYWLKIRYKNYWLNSQNKQLTSNFPPLKFRHEFINNYKNQPFGTKNMFGIINPYLKKLENEVFIELVNSINEIEASNLKFRYKWYLTKEMWIYIQSEKIDNLLIMHSKKLVSPHYSFNPLFEILPSKGGKHIVFLINLLFDNKEYQKINWYQLRVMYSYIFQIQTQWKNYPDRSKNAIPARNYLEKKIVEDASNTHKLHTSTVKLAPYYHDERMLLVLLSIEKYLDDKEDKKALLKMLQPYKKLVKKYSPKSKRKLNKVIKCIENLK